LKEGVAKFSLNFRYIDRDPDVVQVTLSKEEAEALMQSAIGIYKADPKIEIKKVSNQVYWPIVLIVILCIVSALGVFLCFRD
jgi:hypothetical protein